MKYKKDEINPMHREHKYSFMLSPRCGAKARTNHYLPCRAPAVHGKKRCRMHGGAKGSGAPERNRNSLKHGHTTRESLAKRNEIRSLIKQCREFMDDHEW